MQTRINNRYQAFGIHLGISVLVFIVLSSLIVFFWYPSFLFSTDGGWQGIRIIAGVDLVIGPLLTLLLYKKGKPGLKFDLICISLVQLSCLSLGMYIVYQERPIAVVFANGTFYSMSKASFESQKIDYHRIEGVNMLSPAWIYINLPESTEERRKAIASQLSRGPLYTQTERYLPFHENLDKVLAKGLRFDQLKDVDADPIPAKDMKYFKLVSRYKYGYLGFNEHTGKHALTLDSRFKINL